MELSSYLLEIPNDTDHLLLGQFLIGCSISCQAYCKLIRSSWIMVTRHLSLLNCPIVHSKAVRELLIHSNDAHPNIDPSQYQQV